MTRTIKEWQEYIRGYHKNRGFTWDKDEIDTMLLRLHSEVSEAGEAARDNNYEHLGEELADTFIRLVDTCEVMGIDLEAEAVKKMAINKKRPVLHGRARK